MQNNSIFSQKFSIAEREISRLKSKVNLKRKGFIFWKHVYSIEELVNSPHHRKIYAVCEKIGDDVMQWQKTGNLSDDELNAYQAGRDRIQRKYRRVNKEIEEREPTFLEKFLSLLEGFVASVARVLPTLKKIIKLVRLIAGIPKLLPEPSPHLLLLDSSGLSQ